MNTQKRYSPEFRERAVRLFEELQYFTGAFENRQYPRVAEDLLIGKFFHVAAAGRYLQAFICRAEHRLAREDLTDRGFDRIVWAP